jgi:hypothetical protein
MNPGGADLGTAFGGRTKVRPYKDRGSAVFYKESNAGLTFRANRQSWADLLPHPRFTTKDTGIEPVTACFVTVVPSW